MKVLNNMFKLSALSIATLGLAACGDSDDPATGPAPFDCQGVGYVKSDGSLDTNAPATHYVYKVGGTIKDGGTDLSGLVNDIAAQDDTPEKAVSDIAYIHDSNASDIGSLITAMGAMKNDTHEEVQQAMNHICYATASATLGTVDLSSDTLTTASLNTDDLAAITPVINKLIDELGAADISYTLGDSAVVDANNTIDYNGLTLTTSDTAAIITEAAGTDFTNIAFEGDKIVTVEPSAGGTPAPFEYANLADLVVAYTADAANTSTAIPLFKNATFNATLNLDEATSQIDISPVLSGLGAAGDFATYLADLVAGATSSEGDYEIDLNTQDFLKGGNQLNNVADKAICDAILSTTTPATNITCLPSA